MSKRIALNTKSWARMQRLRGIQSKDLRPMKVTLRHTIGAVILMGGLAAPVAGWGYCSPPSAPYCATQYGPFDDTYDFDRCKSEMQSYKDEVESFLSCQRRDNERAIDEEKTTK